MQRYCFYVKYGALFVSICNIEGEIKKVQLPRVAPFYDCRGHSQPVRFLLCVFMPQQLSPPEQR